MATLQEQLATATIAKIFGSELKSVDESTTHQSSAGPATKIDPMSFITAVQENKRQQVERATSDANRLAEQLYPLPSPEPAPVVPQVPLNVPVPQQVNHIVQQVPAEVSYALTKEDVQSIRSQLDRINGTLTKMAGMLGKVFESYNKK